MKLSKLRYCERYFPLLLHNLPLLLHDREYNIIKMFYAEKGYTSILKREQFFEFLK